jgi:beta-glucanase (GH16 family)
LKAKPFGLLAAVMLVATGCGTTSSVDVVAATAPMTPAVTSAASAYKLVWSDEFSGTRLSSAWKPRSAGGPAAKRSCAVVAPSQTTVSGGNARLSVRADPTKSQKTKTCPSGQMLNAMVGTQESKSFQYGLFTARIKYAEPRGEHGSFWLQPGGPTGASAPGNGGAEIDVSEYFGKGYRQGGLASFVYFQGKKIGGLVPKSVNILGKGKTPYNGYHEYSVEWTPASYIFRIDGKETLRITQGISHHPEYLILSLMTSDYELPNLPKKKLPTKMSVDWVRVWQK